MADKKRGRPKKSQYGEELEGKILKIFGDEYAIASENKEHENSRFNEYYDMLHCIRTNELDGIESDVFMPEFVSRVLTLVADFVSRYFQSRDYVETRVENDDPRDMLESKASRHLLNTILGRRDTHYFEKIVRLLMFVIPSGYGIIKGGYDQRIENVIVGYEDAEDYVYNEDGERLAEDGNVYADPYTQTPMKEIVSRPVTESVVVCDTPTFEVYPNQDVFFSPEYAYTLNDKEWVIFRGEKTLAQLEADAALFGYFNLDVLKKNPPADGSRKKKEETTLKGSMDQEPEPQEKKFTILERWGRAWVKVKEYDEAGKPLDYEPGYDKKTGKPLDGAELHECIVTWVVTGWSEQPSVLIRFQVSPHTRRPMVRFKCYIDSLKDTGFGDGEIVQELQLGVNDIINLTNFRTMLATTPAFKAKRYAGIPQNIKISPTRAIEVEQLEDLQELTISDNIQGGLAQYGTFIQGIDRAMAVYPHRMGAQTDAVESATAASIMDSRANIRASLRTMTLEYAGFVDFYDMLLTLCNDFMLPETLESILGPELVYAYNPQREDRFVPVSQAIETEENKHFKIKMWDQIMGRIVAIPNPRTPIVANYILGQIIELMGGDFKHFKKFMFEENAALNQQFAMQGGMGKGGPSTPNANPNPAQNQTMMPQRGTEQAVRGAAQM